MKFTVRDALDLDALKRTSILAGHEGLENEIKSITILDTPDIKYWLKGGEFLLTNAFVYKDNTQQLINLINDIKEAGASALGIKLKRFVQNLPPDMITLANKHKIPLIAMPIECSWIDIMGPVMTEIINRKTVILEKSMEIHRIFTDIVLNGGNIKSIIDRLVELTGLSIIFITEGKTVESSKKLKGSIAEFDKEVNYITSNWKEILDYRVRTDTKVQYSKDSKYIIMPVNVEGKVYGHIVGITEEKGLDRIDLVAFQLAATNIAIEILKEKTIKETEKRYKYDFLLDLLSGNIKSRDVIESRGEFYGWDLSGKFIVVAIDFDNFNEYYLKEVGKNEKEIEMAKNKLVSIVEKQVSRYFLKSIYMNKSDSIIVLVNIDEFQEKNFKNTLMEVCNNIIGCVKKTFDRLTVSIGIGTDYNVHEIFMSYNEAKQAIGIGRKAWGKGKVYHYNDLGIYKFIVQDSVKQYVNEFYNDTVKKIIDYDNEKDSSLVETLEAYLACNGIGEAATKLFIHPNTLRYRLQRIEEITGLQLSNCENRLNLEIGLKIHKLKEENK